MEQSEGAGRNIADVATAWPTATCPEDTVDRRASLELKNTLNTMVDQLNGFDSR